MAGTTDEVGVSIGEGKVDDSGGFCEGNFWDTSLTWDTNDPDFTACFHQTVTVFLRTKNLWTKTLSYEINSNAESVNFN